MSYDSMDDSELLEKRFRRLAKQWEEDPDVLVSSSITQMSQHPDYQAIVAMGWDAVPFILRELTKKPGHWFMALHTITGEDPVPEDCRDDLRKMTDCWLAWGKARDINLPEKEVIDDD